jgi:hypothetical protein
MRECYILHELGVAGMLRSLLFATLLAWLCHGLIDAQCIPPERSLRTETFSTIKEVSGQDYPAGSELQLEEQGERVIATLTDYRGSSVPVKTKLQGTLEESKAENGAATCKVHLSGQDRRGPLRVEGEITPARFLGMVRRRIGKDVLSFRLSLGRKMQLGDDRVARERLVPPLQVFACAGRKAACVIIAPNDGPDPRHQARSV